MTPPNTLLSLSFVVGGSIWILETMRERKRRCREKKKPKNGKNNEGKERKVPKKKTKKTPKNGCRNKIRLREWCEFERNGTERGVSERNRESGFTIVLKKYSMVLCASRIATRG